MKLLKVGIIGQGRSGHDIHAKTLKGLPELFEIAAVSDYEVSYRKRAEEEFGCEAYEDYKQLFEREDLDLIVNASPSHLHVPITLECLEHGFHVLCEKPLARTAEEVDTLIDAASRAGKLLTIFQQSRYSPAFQQIMEVVGSGVLGRIVQVSISFNGFARRWDWQTLQANNGGNLLNTGPHPLDQALQLFGTDSMPEIMCFMDRVNTFGDAEDYVKLIMHKNNHPLLDLEITSCDAYPGTTYRIQAQYGGISGTGTKLNWKYFRPEEAPEQQLIRTPLKHADGSPAYGSETLPWIEKQWELPEEQKDMLGHVCRTFYGKLHAALVNGEPLDITPQQVRQQIAVIEECHRQNPLPRL
ncbi:Gfo/Idh/MocA family protein [Paenibacillus nasutitermitis]|uniref:Oxidoreductase n=1 Tax=Paenibacillus nasutitermitis TaxID=1652958 RepID=A0A916YNS1_9BACL|nr:Gfo/Idh/MocA family oxidoreductase [Paenibacillus nasutitermitis]GGD53560.1 oxidoreductase [Paenibacillus nasutitermitis]